MTNQNKPNKDIFCGPDVLAKVSNEIAINYTLEKGWLVQMATGIGIFEGNHNALLNAACGKALKAWRQQARLQQKLINDTLKEIENLWATLN